MKNRLLLVVFLIAVSTSSFIVKAQDSKISLGAGLNYATDIENIGISLQGLYSINSEWEVSPKFTYFFKKNYTTYSTLDFDGHYVFSDNGTNAFYAIGGINLTFFKYKYDGPSLVRSFELGDDFEEAEDLYNDIFSGISNNLEWKDNEAGINLGVGARFSLTDALSVCTEAKYTTTYSGFLSVGAALMYKF
jgi:hypothetical protein